MEVEGTEPAHVPAMKLEDRDHHEEKVTYKSYKYVLDLDINALSFPLTWTHFTSLQGQGDQIQMISYFE
jgi:hypothetical protein